MAAAQPAKGPSTSKSENVDLYSDLYPSDEDLDKITEANELFDAVLTGTVDEDKKVSSKPVSTKKAFGEEDDITDKTAQNEGKRARNLSIYVGNFPWWTSDHDLKSLAQKLGVEDIADIKFAENKANGQSRGYAEVVVASEQSLKILLEKMPQFCINGEKIQCRFATQQNLSVFEGIANKRIPLRARLGSRDSDFVEKTQTATPSQEMSALPVPLPLFPSHPFANMFPSPPTPFLGQPPPLFPHMAPMVPPLIPPPVFPPHPGQIPGQSPPELHINPPFFNLPQDGQNSKSHTEKKQTSYSENGEYEEQMNRNRAIASSAITKAVSGAASGDVHMAMETLITAISIIKESRVYEDEYCQALVTSLKDCLFSIQGDYSPKQSRHSREKDRDRGRDRDHDRERDYERDRERDRERARERYRERDDAYDRKSVGGSRRYRERTSSEERDRERSRDRERHRDHRDRYH